MVRVVILCAVGFVFHEEVLMAMTIGWVSTSSFVWTCNGCSFGGFHGSMAIGRVGVFCGLWSIVFDND